MSFYGHRGQLRVAVLDSLPSPDAPTVAQLNAGVDVSCDLLPGGLSPRVSTSTETYQPWHSDQVREWPVSWGSGWDLSGYRRRPPAAEALWDACATFRGAAFVVVRYGVASDVAWAAGQSVHVTQGRWGKRAMSPSGSTAATFSVTLHGMASWDDATVVA